MVQVAGRLPLALVLALFLPGCLSPASTSGGDPSEVPTTETLEASLDWELTGCLLSVAILRVDSAALEPHLPKGFTPLSLGEVLGGPETGDAAFGVEGFRCASGTTPAGEVDDVSFGFYWAAVEPPEDVRDADAWLHVVHWNPLISHDGWREALAARGIPTIAGEASISFSGTADARAATATIDFEREHHTMEGAAVLTNQALTEGARIVHFQATPTGLATWTMYSQGESVLDGNAVVRLAAGSLPAQLVGDTETAALLGTATGYSLTQGQIIPPN